MMLWIDYSLTKLNSLEVMDSLIGVSGAIEVIKINQR